MNLKKWNSKNWMSLMVATAVVYSVGFSYTAQAQPRKNPPPPGGQTERRVDQDANIISEFNILNDAIEAGAQRGLDVNAKFQLIDLMKQANALLGAVANQYPQPLPPIPAQIRAGDQVILDPNQVPNHWYGLDILIVQSVDMRMGEAQVYNPTKNASGRFRLSALLRTVSSYGGMQVGQSVRITDSNHWWNRNRADAYIDAIFMNGTFKLKCPRLNAEGMFSFGQFMRI